MIVNELGKEAGPSSADDDEPQTDIDFYVDRDMINIADTKVARHVGEHFIRHIQKLQEVQDVLKRLDIQKPWSLKSIWAKRNMTGWFPVNFV